LNFNETIISNDTVLIGQTVHIANNLEINANASLNLEKCCVKVSQGVAINCMGRLIAFSTSFLPLDGQAGWNGIVLSGSGVHGSSFTDCLFEGGCGSVQPDCEGANGGAVTLKMMGAASVKFLKCRFDKNHAKLGGAVFIRDEISGALPQKTPAVKFAECIFENCNADFGGAAAVVYSGSASFEKCGFNGSHAQSGGAIYSYDNSVVEVSGSRFENCRSSVAGGAVTSRFSYFRDSENSYSACVSSGKDEQGGAIYLQKCDSRIVSSSFTGCSAHSGGAVMLTGGAVRIVKCSFYGCIARVAGCALALCRACEGEIADCRFAGCVKNLLGNQDGTVTIKDCDIKIERCYFSGGSASKDYYISQTGYSVKVLECKFSAE